MTSKREKAKLQKSLTNEQCGAENTGQHRVVNQRKEKIADFLIDLAKYVLTGVIITSLFNDVKNKAILYFVGCVIVAVSILGGLKLTNKRKE
jgi:Na+/glutamate symporter